MISGFVNKIIRLRGLNFRFDLPKKKIILQYDDLNSNILQKTIKKNFNILQVREEKEIYFWILLKQLILLNFKLITYYKNFIKFTSPKIIITTTDNNIQFYELKKNFKDIQFISIQMEYVLNIGSKVKFLKNIETLRVTIFLFTINI